MDNFDKLKTDADRIKAELRYKIIADLITFLSVGWADLTDKQQDEIKTTLAINFDQILQSHGL